MSSSPPHAVLQQGGKRGIVVPRHQELECSYLYPNRRPISLSRPSLRPHRPPNVRPKSSAETFAQNSTPKSSAMVTARHCSPRSSPPLAFFPFLRQATATRRGIPRKRCRPTPPCLTHPPSCPLSFSPSGRRSPASFRSLASRLFHQFHGFIPGLVRLPRIPK